MSNTKPPGVRGHLFGRLKPGWVKTLRKSLKGKRPAPPKSDTVTGKKK